MVILPTEKRFDWQRTPLSLLLLVLLNVLVFFLYQSGDGEKFQQAMASYQQNNLFEQEWPAYKAYLLEIDRSEDAAQFQELVDQGMEQMTAQALLMDFDFRPWLDVHAREYITNIYYDDWSFYRQEVNRQLDSLSFFAGGLIPTEMEPLSFTSYQFMHGDIMHLLGNMFFLLVCGFAVEAAIGHLRFLFFYLISGIAGGLLHALLNLESSTTLIGASGAVSGVMAMYLGVFRLRKIEFFYWFFIFVGYFRAPALLILPVYVGKELVDYFSSGDSNVAFMAHVGGFVAGAALIAATLLLNPKLVDTEYVEEDQERDPFQDGLARIYGYIENFQFQAALKAVQEMTGEFGPRFELALLRCNLLKIERGEEFRNALLEALAQRENSPRHLLQQERLWREHSDLHEAMDDDLLIGLGIRLADPAQFTSAEQIWKCLEQRKSRHLQLSALARRLAQAAALLDLPDKQERYHRLAREHLPG